MSAMDDGTSTTRALLLAGILGVVGHTIGVVADLSSGYSLDGADAVSTAFSVLRMDVLSVFLVSKPTGAVVLGHYLAIFGIPLGLFGLWHVTRALEPADQAAVGVVWFLGVLTYIVGIVFHSGFAFVTFGVQAAASVPPAADGAMRTMLERFALVFEPVAFVLLAGMLLVFGLLLVVVASGRTAYPRWFALANPLVIQAVTGAAALVAPLEIRVVLIVTAFNLSLAIFYAVSTVLVGTGRTVDRGRAESASTRPTV